MKVLPVLISLLVVAPESADAPKIVGLETEWTESGKTVAMQGYDLVVRAQGLSGDAAQNRVRLYSTKRPQNAREKGPSRAEFHLFKTFPGKAAWLKGVPNRIVIPIDEKTLPGEYAVDLASSGGTSAKTYFRVDGLDLGKTRVNASKTDLTISPEHILSDGLKARVRSTRLNEPTQPKVEHCLELVSVKVGYTYQGQPGVVTTWGAKFPAKLPPGNYQVRLEYEKPIRVSIWHRFRVY